MFITALFTIAKTWKQPKGSLTEEQIKKTCYAYTYIHTYTHTHTHTHIVEYYSGIKKIIMPFAATRTDIEIVILK